MDRPPSTFRPESLLAHREWVERTARALVYGDAEAEDLQQQAWLKVLEHPPVREPASPRGWFRTVLKFTAIDASRRARARRVHERAAARPERLDASPAELVARAETLDRVAHAVLELDEPYRATVLLRYFEGLEAQSIAEIQGIPVETVRTRLKRAVAQLRERLDAENRGDRRRWCLALLPLFRRPSPGIAATAGTATSAAAGVLLMGIKTKVVVAAAILLAFGGGIILVRPWASVDPGTPVPPRIPVVPITATEIRPTEGAVTSPRLPNFRARVEDAEGKPIPGAHVEVRPARDGQFAAWSGDRTLATGTTDDNGSLALDLPAEALTQSREVLVSRPGYTKATVRTNDPEVVIRLSPAAILRGRVFEASTGKGVGQIPLVAVRGRPGSWESVGHATSDAEGAFAMEDLPPGTYTLQARPSSWLDAEVPDLHVELGAPRVVEVPLLPGIRMEGRVLDADSGAPVTKGRVLAPGRAGMEADKVALLDREGRFVLAGLPAWMGVNPSDYYLLDAEGYDRSPRTEKPAAYDMDGNQTREAVLRARQETWWEARVLDPDGKGVPGARVVIGTVLILQELQALDREGDSYVGNARGRLRETVTDAEGRCRLPAGWLMRAQGNNSWEQRLLVLHPSFAPYYESVGPGFWRNPGEIRLDRGLRLDVEVVDSRGSPEAGAVVRTALSDPNQEFKGWATGDVFGSFQGPAIADPTGRVSLPAMCAGDWEIRAWSADGLRRAVNSVRLEGTDPVGCRLTLEDAPPVLGTVLDAETGKPLPGAVVLMVSGRTGGPRRTVADAEGRFEFRFVEKDPLLPGFVLSVADVPAPGVWLPVRVDAVQAGTPVTLQVPCFVRETRQIAGKVLDASTGAPIPDGLIKCQWLDLKNPGNKPGGLDRRFTGGAYDRPIPVVPGLRLTFWSTNYEPRTLPIEELEAMGFEVRLVPKGTPASAAAYRLRVKVTVAGLPATKERISYGAAWVYLYDPETKRPFKRRGTEWDLQPGTGTLPEFVLTEHELPGPRRVLLELQVPGCYMAAPTECTIGEGKETECAIDLLEGGGTLSGTADGKPGESVVLLTYPNGLVRRLGMGEEGKFWAGQLAPGAYTLAIDGGEPVTAVIENGVKTVVTLKK